MLKNKTADKTTSVMAQGNN